MSVQILANEIRATHPYAFRSGQWAKLAGRTVYNERLCYHVRFEDGAEDWWAISAKEHGYQFRIGGTA